MWTNADLVLACARGTSQHGGNQVLGEHTYAAVLSALSSWLTSLFARHRGGNLPTFARFTWQRVDEHRDDGSVVMRPVFVPSNAFLRTHLLHTATGSMRGPNAVAEELEPCEDYSAVKIAIKFSCSLNKDVVSSCMRHLLHQLGEALRSGQPVGVDLGIGVLTGQDRAVDFRFKPGYLVHRPAATPDGRQQQQGRRPGGQHEVDVRNGRPDQNQDAQDRGKESWPTQKPGEGQPRAMMLSGCGSPPPRPVANDERGTTAGLPVAAELKSTASEEHTAAGGPLARTKPIGPDEAAYTRPSSSPRRANGPGPCTPRAQNRQAADCGASSVMARPAWGARVPPASPRSRTTASPSAGRYDPRSPGRDGGTGGAGGCDAVTASPGAEAASYGTADAVDVMTEAMPIARTIQLALRTPRFRPASPGPQIGGRTVRSDAGGASRARPASAPRDVASWKGVGRQAQLAYKGASGGAPTALVACQSSDQGEAHLLHLYAAASLAGAIPVTSPDGKTLQPASVAAIRSGYGALEGALGCPPASPRANTPQRPPWGAGQGARQRLNADAGSGAQRPTSAPRLRAQAPAATVAPAASAAAPVALAPGPAGGCSSVAVRDDQPAWCRGAWMTRGADVNQLWSPDSKSLGWAKPNVRAVVRTGGRDGALDQVAAGISGRDARTRRAGTGPAGRAGLVSPRTGHSGHQPHLEAPASHVDRDALEEGSVGEDGRDRDDDRSGLSDASHEPMAGNQAQRSQRARKLLFLSPQKGTASHARQQARGDIAQPRHQAVGDTIGAGFKLQLLDGMEPRDQDPAHGRQRDQFGMGMGVRPVPAGGTRGVATVRTLSPRAHSQPLNLRYGRTAGGSADKEAGLYQPDHPCHVPDDGITKTDPGDAKGRATRQPDEPWASAIVPGSRVDSHRSLAGWRQTPAGGLDELPTDQDGWQLRRAAGARAGASVPAADPARLLCNMGTAVATTDAGSTPASAPGADGDLVDARRSSSGGFADEDWHSAAFSSDSFSFPDGHPLPLYRSSTSRGSTTGGADMVADEALPGVLSCLASRHQREPTPRPQEIR